MKTKKRRNVKPVSKTKRLAHHQHKAHDRYNITQHAQARAHAAMHAQCKHVVRPKNPSKPSGATRQGHKDRNHSQGQTKVVESRQRPRYLQMASRVRSSSSSSLGAVIPFFFLFFFAFGGFFFRLFFQLESRINESLGGFALRWMLSFLSSAYRNRSSTSAPPPSVRPFNRQSTGGGRLEYLHIPLGRGGRSGVGSRGGCGRGGGGGFELGIVELD